MTSIARCILAGGIISRRALAVANDQVGFLRTLSTQGGCRDSYSTPPCPPLCPPQKAPKPGCSSNQKPACAPIPRPGCSANPKPACAPIPRPGYAPIPRPGCSANPKPACASIPRPGCSANPKPACAPIPRPGCSANPKPANAPFPRPGCTTNPKPGCATNQCKPVAATSPCPGASTPASCREGRIKENDRLQCADFKLYEGSTCAPIDLGKLLCGKKVLIVGVHGAFIPYCSKNHLPNYVLHQREFSCKGVHEVLCVSVNDSFVMDAWGKAHKAKGKVRMIADPTGSFTKALGMDIDLSSSGLGHKRSRSYAMLIDDGVVRLVIEEPNAISYVHTSPKSVLRQVQSVL